jgi:hypothetical protein
VNALFKVLLGPVDLNTELRKILNRKTLNRGSTVFLYSVIKQSGIFHVLPQTITGLRFNKLEGINVAECGV